MGLEPWPVSAISGTGTGELLDQLVGTLPPPKGMEKEEEDDKPLAIAIVGRPNVGECGCWHGWGGGGREERESSQFIIDPKSQQLHLGHCQCRTRMQAS